MAASKTYTQLDWQAGAQIYDDLVNDADSGESQALTLQTDAVKMDITLSVTNQSGTVTAGDYIVFKALWSTGDAESATDTTPSHDTTDHAEIIATMYPVGSSGTVQKTVALDKCPKVLKVYAEQSAATTVTNRVFAEVCEYSV